MALSADSLAMLPDIDSVVSLSRSSVDIPGVVRMLLEQAAAGSSTSIGFPGAIDIDYSPVLPLFERLWNNIGDPATDPGGAAHTKSLERAVIAWCADLVDLPAEDRWGYITAGGTEGNIAALYAASQRHPGSIAYYSRAAHYSIQKALDIVGVDSALVDTADDGEMNYGHLAELVVRHGRRPAIVIATAGTTMTEAVDNVGSVRGVLRASGVTRGHVHVDAALSGIPLALEGALRLGDGGGIDSIAVSGHKFFGAPIPCGVVLMRESIRHRAKHIPYTATLDTTIAGSRCGQAAALLWYAIALHGCDGHRARVASARALAAYAAERLSAIGWPAWRHSHAFTVVLRTPPDSVRKKWLLATDGQWSHLICMPGITRGRIDAFVADVGAAAGGSSHNTSSGPRDQSMMNHDVPAHILGHPVPRGPDDAAGRKIASSNSNQPLRHPFGADVSESTTGESWRASAAVRETAPVAQTVKQHHEQRFGSRPAVNGGWRAEKVVLAGDTDARRIGYRNLEHLLRETSHLTYKTLGDMTGWSRGQIYRRRMKFQIRGNSGSQRMARRESDHRAGLDELPQGIQPQDCGGRLRCRYCGRWFERLGQHLQLAHGVTAVDYRRSFGLDAGVKLQSEASCRRRAAAARKAAAAALVVARGKAIALRMGFDEQARMNGHVNIVEMLRVRSSNVEVAALLVITPADARKIRRRYLSDPHHGMYDLVNF